MKYLVYVALAFVAGLLFLPKSGTSEIRNLPLLILIASLLLIFILVRILKYAILTIKAKRILKNNGAEIYEIRFLPWASAFNGHYSIVFKYKGQSVQLVFLSRKIKYQRYHFDSIDLIEFYRSNRVVFQSIKAKGAIISKLVETNQVGKQRIKWNNFTQIRAIVFDKFYFSNNERTYPVNREPVEEVMENLPHAFQLFLDKLNGKDVALVDVFEAADRNIVMESRKAMHKLALRTCIFHNFSIYLIRHKYLLSFSLFCFKNNFLRANNLTA